MKLPDFTTLRSLGFRRGDARGVALVITLILLAVITTLAIAFLAITRRETVAVGSMAGTTDAEMAADSALERAKAEILAVYPMRNQLGAVPRVTNILGPDMFVSVCCHNYVPDPSDPLNPAKAKVFRYNRESPDQRLSFAYDAAPPVFVDTNRPVQLVPRGPLDDRFFVDLNRNGVFEETGNVTNTVDGTGSGPGGFPVDPVGGIEWRIGDPQWIGVLRNPRRPLSADNPFIARYAFVVLPAGRSLDVNWIHNDSNDTNTPPVGGSWYSRNQGIGTYEINLAAFLRELNANTWPSYTLALGGPFANTGVAFNDGLQIYSARFGGSRLPDNRRLRDYFPLNAALSAIEYDRLDLFGNYEYFFDPALNPIDNWPWPGGESRRHFFSPHDYFSSNAIPRIGDISRPGFIERLQGSGTLGNSYDRYTFYRMLAQLGTDSDEEEEGKVNINFVNVRSWANGSRILASDMIPWSVNDSNIVVPRLGGSVEMGRRLPEIFFLTTFTNLIAREPDLASFVTNRINGTVLSIPVFTNGSTYSTTPYSDTNRIRGPLYSARLHQLLQIAANIYDATISNRVSAAAGSPHFPTVFRPRFRREPDGNVYITDYSLVDQSADDFLVNKWVDLDAGESIASVNDLVYGIPLIVGARSGLPSFNELGVVSVAQATRKLIMARSSTTGLTPARPWTKLDQRFNLDVRTMLQVEARNSNTRPYPNRLQMITLSSPIVILQTNNNGPSIIPTNWVTGSTNFFDPAIPRWGAEVVGSENPDNTNLVVSSLLVTNLLNYVVMTNAESSPMTNQWVLTIKNRLLFYLIDRDPIVNPKGRIIDIVSLNRPNSVFEIGKELEKEVEAGGSIKDIWSSRKEGTVTQGIMTQIRVSQSGNVPDNVWGSWEDSANKAKSILHFREFYTDTSKLETNQVPFTPSRVLVQAAYYQVDDPLVHYTFEDLRDDPNPDKKKTGTVPLFSDYTNLTVKLYGRNTHSLGWNKGSFAPDVENPGEGTLDPTIRDPGMIHPSLWRFPTSLFPSIGWLGRVHRGTPWQTIYMKSQDVFPQTNKFRFCPYTDRLEALNNWIAHTGNQRGYDPDQKYAVDLLRPQRDWELFDVFTTAPHPNATRGRLSVNQTNQAAWSAVLSGIQASVPKPSVDEGYVDATSETIQPFGVLPSLTPDAVLRITQSINTNRFLFGSNAYNPRGEFRQIGQILSVPELSDWSPFLTRDLSLFSPCLDTNLPPDHPNRGPRGNALIYDEDYERIPQQILSLLKVGEPKFVVYAWGQSLKPARAGVQLNGTRTILQPLSGPSINVDGDRLVNNYQITGEMATKAVVRVVFPERLPPADGGGIDYRRPKLVVESFNVIDLE